MLAKTLLNLFGDKPWYTSLTALGVVVFAAGQAYCSVGLVEGVSVLPAAGLVCKASVTLGPILAALGIRRAQNVEYE